MGVVMKHGGGRQLMNFHSSLMSFDVNHEMWKIRFDAYTTDFLICQLDLGLLKRAFYSTNDAFCYLPFCLFASFSTRILTAKLPKIV